ncbi:Aminotran-1-2 domain-containing protein [Mycena indigotica]|uniref:Aminotran-1-2 domain-containing protein n=1 Tax=Mycena indigotica TaxID=2126181 RepID=A0A8H6T2J8_9AGAR|nr:Aminotran-1-2 domain-containing protein [Mycena indigotica]KAF7309739.1 Aminotran-1-2 domain-containing protein [Mycena indigotica]
MSEKHDAVDLSHHISDFAKTLDSRLAFGKPGPPGTISLDGGVPDTEYFPIESITVEYLKPDSFPLKPTDALPHGPGVLGWIANVLTGKSNKTTDSYTISRRLGPDDQSKFELKTALTYSPITGLPALETIVADWVKRVHQPAYSNYATLVDVGASCAWSSCLSILLNPGDSFITDRYAYNAALYQARARDVHPVAVATDLDGLSAVDLEHVLANWDEKARGLRRPRVIYTQGGIQNPTGLMISTQRKKDIYDIVVRYDLIIVEDDPYYFQQASHPYQHNNTVPQPQKQSDEEWIDSLVPSFLRFDYEGRVIRLDTFSKTIGPGGRLGYYTGSPQLLEKLQALHQSYITFPSGVAQAVFGELLHRYQSEGFARWLRGLTSQYELRRNWAIDALYDALDLHAKSQTRALVAYAPSDGQISEKSKPKTSLMSFVPPDGGMFMWFNIHLHNHPRYHALARQTSPAAAKNALATELWTAIADAGVILRRGELFASEDDEERVRLGEEDIFLRASFSYGPREDLEKAFKIFASVLVKFFE